MYQEGRNPFGAPGGVPRKRDRLNRRLGTQSYGDDDFYQSEGFGSFLSNSLLN